MALLQLNCPRCLRQLVYVPLDGLTLYYRCRDHGPLILRPLVQVSADDPNDAESRSPGDNDTASCR